MPGHRLSPDSGDAVSALTIVLEAFAAGDLDKAAACFSEDAVYRESRGAQVRGRAAIAEHFARFAASGVRWRFIVDDVLRDGNRACIVYRFAVPGGTGRPWRERAGCATVRIGEGGSIDEWREYEG